MLVTTTFEHQSIGISSQENEEERTGAQLCYSKQRSFHRGRFLTDRMEE